MLHFEKLKTQQLTTSPENVVTFLLNKRSHGRLQQIKLEIPSERIEKNCRSLNLLNDLLSFEK